MIFGYRSGFCGVWVVWNYYTDTVKMWTNCKCKPIPVLFQAVFLCAFCNKFEHWPQVKFLTITRSSQSNRKWNKRFVFAVCYYLIKCICSEYKCISMVYKSSCIIILSFISKFWYFNTFNNYSTTFSTKCWKLKITLLNIKV